MRHGLLLLAGLLALTACKESDELDTYDHQRRVTGPPPQPWDGRFVITHVDGTFDAAVPPDAAVDATVDATVDAAPADAAVDAAAADAAAYTCHGTADCTLAVRLRTCDPCPTAATGAEIGADPCTVAWVPGATVFSYDQPDCVAACPFSEQSCVDPAGGLDCRAGSCVALP
jgi:hypothetical protein